VPEDSPCNSRDYIDGVTYWKGLFRQSQYEILQLQNKFGALEKENEALRQEVTLNKRKADSEAGGTRKATRKKTKRVDTFECELTAIDFPEHEGLNGTRLRPHAFSSLTSCRKQSVIPSLCCIQALHKY
jgi:hypothetical protein